MPDVKAVAAGSHAAFEHLPPRLRALLLAQLAPQKLPPPLDTTTGRNATAALACVSTGRPQKLFISQELLNSASCGPERLGQDLQAQKPQTVPSLSPSPSVCWPDVRLCYCCWGGAAFGGVAGPGAPILCSQPVLCVNTAKHATGDSARGNPHQLLLLFCDNRRAGGWAVWLSGPCWPICMFVDRDLPQGWWLRWHAHSLGTPPAILPGGISCCCSEGSRGTEGSVAPGSISSSSTWLESSVLSCTSPHHTLNPWLKICQVQLTCCRLQASTSFLHTAPVRFLYPDGRCCHFLHQALISILDLAGKICPLLRLPPVTLSCFHASHALWNKAVRGCGVPLFVPSCQKAW